MKISEIVKVSINGTVSSAPIVSQMNNTGAIIFAYVKDGDETAPMTNDFTWKKPSDLGAAYLGDTAINRAVDTYQLNGGVELVVKRLYFEKGVSEVQLTDEIDKAVHGGTGVLESPHTALDTSIKNIQLVWNIDGSSPQPSLPISAIAEKLLVSGNPQETKILFVTSISDPVGLIKKPNIFYHYIGSVTNQQNYFESIAAMAYLSKINYEVDQIQDYEYTIWGNGDIGVNLINNIDRRVVEAGGKVNFFSKTAGLNVLIGGVMTNEARLLSYYFGIILADRISTILAGLTLSKLKFQQSTYGYIYNLLTIELDKFANNGLLDTEFVNREARTVFRDDVQYTLVEADQVLDYGYVVNTLPATQSDLDSRKYTGVYIVYAIANQIRTMEIEGIVLGGI